ncbi:MAG: hypothetical protein V4621_08280 [Pseudomonadota bacterium]
MGHNLAFYAGPATYTLPSGIWTVLFPRTIVDRRRGKTYFIQNRPDFEDIQEARLWMDEMNAMCGITREEALAIVLDTAVLHHDFSRLQENSLRRALDMLDTPWQYSHPRL